MTQSTAVSAGETVLVLAAAGGVGLASVQVAKQLGARVIAAESVSALGGFLYADALSALVVGLTALVALASGIYSVGYLRRDAGAGRITATQVHRYYTLTPVFVFAICLAASLLPYLRIRRIDPAVVLQG